MCRACIESCRRIGGGAHWPFVLDLVHGVAWRASRGDVTDPQRRVSAVECGIAWCIVQRRLVAEQSAPRGARSPGEAGRLLARRRTIETACAGLRLDEATRARVKEIVADVMEGKPCG